MSLFDDVFETQKSEEESMFSPAEALAAIAVGAIASDGYLSPEEARCLSLTLSRMQLYRSYSDDVMVRMCDKLLALLRRDGFATLMSLAKASLPYELKETAFAIATDLILADGTVTQEENNFLNNLYQMLEIKDDVALKIVEVMMIKNKG